MADDRLPPLPDADLTEEQRVATELIASGPRGEVVGPFVPLSRSPELMTRLQLVGEYLRFDSVLDDDLVELVILSVARQWDNDFEWSHHQPIALQKGLSEEVVDDIGHGRRPSSGSPRAVAVWDLVEELQKTHQVSNASYAAALDLLGEQRVVEVVGVTGYYTTLAMTMNLARTPAPSGPRLPNRG